MDQERISQEDLARRVDKSFVSVNRWLTGKRAWPFDVVIAIKKLSGGLLTDESFAASKAPKKTRKRLPNKAA